MELTTCVSLNVDFAIPGEIFDIIAEQGTHNGGILDDRLFGAARTQDAILPSIEQFDYYRSGGIGLPFLGMDEADERGNVNVLHLGGNHVGPNGFMKIA